MFPSCRGAVPRLASGTVAGVNCWFAWRRSRGGGQQAEAASQDAQQRLKELEDEKQLIRLFADTLEQVKSKYVESNVSDRELIEAAIQGMISRLDPYSNYIPPQELDGVSQRCGTRVRGHRHPGVGS